MIHGLQKSCKVHPVLLGDEPQRVGENKNFHCLALNGKVFALFRMVCHLYIYLFSKLLLRFTRRIARWMLAPFLPYTHFVLFCLNNGLRMIRPSLLVTLPNFSYGPFAFQLSLLNCLRNCYLFLYYPS